MLLLLYQFHFGLVFVLNKIPPVSYRPSPSTSMSARRFRPSSPQKKKSRQPTPAPSFGLIPISDAPRSRLPRNTTTLGVPRHNTVLVLPAKKRFTQINQPSGKRPAPSNPNEDDPFNAQDYEQDPHIFHHNLDEADVNRNAHKRRCQWRQWQEETIPLLIGPHLTLLRQTNSLRDPPPPSEPPECTCNSSRSLRVLCVHFEREFCLTMCALYPNILLEQNFDQSS